MLNSAFGIWSIFSMCFVFRTHLDCMAGGFCGVIFFLCAMAGAFPCGGYTVEESMQAWRLVFFFRGQNDMRHAFNFVTPP